MASQRHNKNAFAFLTTHSSSDWNADHSLYTEKVLKYANWNIDNNDINGFGSVTSKSQLIVCYPKI